MSNLSINGNNDVSMTVASRKVKLMETRVTSNKEVMVPHIDETNTLINTCSGKKPTYAVVTKTSSAKYVNPVSNIKTRVIGIGNNNAVKAADKTFDVFINNVDIKYTNENMTNMFNMNKIEVIQCTEYPKRVKKSKAFVVKINALDKEKVYKPELWPKNVILSKYSIYDKSNQYKQNGRDETKNQLNSTPII